MGGSVSSLPDKLSEREVMQLSGDKFNKSHFDSLKDGTGLITREQFLTAAQSYENNTPRASDIRAVFMKFCPTGEMSSAQFIKMMKDAKVLTKRFTAGDAELIFMKAKQKQSGGGSVSAGLKVSFDIFCNTAIPAIAEKRGETVERFVDVLANSHGPTLNATQTDNVRFHDDKTSYTGTSSQGGPSTTGDGVHELGDLLDRSAADVRGVKKASIAVTRASATESTDITAAIAAAKEDDGERHQAAVKLQGLGRQLSAKRKTLDIKVARQPQAPAEAKEEPASPRAPPATGSDGLQTVFLKFAKDGNMTSAQFSKMMRDGKILTKKFAAGDAELIYAKGKQVASGGTVAPGQKVPFAIFQSTCLPMIAEKRGQSVDELIAVMCASDGPTLHATATDNVRFHDDKTTYTGTSTQGGPSTGADGAIHDLNQLLDRSGADVRGVKK